MSIAMAPARPGFEIGTAVSHGNLAIVRAAQAGDVEARELLASSCRRTAYLFALQLTGNREDALDLAQEAMLRFFAALARFDPTRPVRPWLLQIVRNLVRDRSRRMRVRRIQTFAPDADVIASEPTDPSPDPEHQARRAELQRLLWSAVCRLPQRYREVVALRDYLGLSYNEIAEALRVPRGTVMSRLHRARTQLRNALLNQLEEEARHG